MSSSPPVPINAPLVPDLSRELPVFQVHASHYRNPEQLPPGAVLVAGAGASGAQIAEELQRAGRRVYLSVGRHRRMPRRYRGRDFIWWLAAMRIDHITPEERGPARLGPVISGAYGGHTIDFRNFAADGMTLLGHIEAAHDGVIEIAPGPCRKSRRRRPRLCHLPRYRGRICETARPGRCPKSPAPGQRSPTRLASPRPCGGSTSRAEGIAAVIWATGYGCRFRLDRYPRHRRQGRSGSPQRHH